MRHHDGVPDATGLLARLDIPGAVAEELSRRNRLLPRRYDDDVLSREPEAVVSWAVPRIRKGVPARREDVVLARKGWRGLRPLSVLALTDRIAYRAHVALLSESLPDRVLTRGPNAEFKQAPLDVEGTRYVLQTDVASFFQYVDHELLGDELVAQTGEEPAVEALLALLGGIAGKRVGIPQISTASDVLGDVYVDPVRRELARSGLSVFRYADDFRVACPSLGAALGALERCDAAVRSLGLTLNERKTLTFARRRYEESLGAFARKEAELFGGDGVGDLSDLDGPYGDGAVSAGDVEAALGLSPTEPAGLEDDDALARDGSQDGPDSRTVRAASRAFDLWLLEDEGAEAQSTQDAAITQSLLSRALPLLGRAGDAEALDSLEAMLTHEPAVTPQICGYLVALAGSSVEAARSVRDAVDDVVGSDVISPWQAMWLADAAGGLPPRRGGQWPGKHVDWLQTCVAEGAPGVSATAGMALGRRRKGDPAVLAAALGRVGDGWRPLLYLGLSLLDPAAADSAADGALDRLLLASARHEA